MCTLNETKNVIHAVMKSSCKYHRKLNPLVGTHFVIDLQNHVLSDLWCKGKFDLSTKVFLMHGHFQYLYEYSCYASEVIVELYFKFIYPLAKLITYCRL